MNVLSLFDGISCGQIALQRAGIKVDNYYASEIDSNAIKITQKNYPNTIQLGDVKNWKSWDLPKIDLVIGGSPCQGFSFAGKQLNFEDPRSKLFFDFVDIINHIKPEYFLLENVVMKQKYQDIITSFLEVEPVLINSNKVSAQMRKRLYWTNVDFKIPIDKEIVLQDILETIEYNLPAVIVGRRINKRGVRDDYNKSVPIIQCLQVRKNVKVSNCLTTVNKDVVLSKLPHGRYLDAYGKFSKEWRHLTNIECERLQTLPDDYTKGIAETQRRRAIGNGWTVDIISHIFKGMN